MDERLDEGNTGAQTGRHSDSALVADRPHLESGVLGHGHDKRDHARLREIDTIDCSTPILEGLALLDGDFVQVTGKQRQVGRR